MSSPSTLMAVITREPASTSELYDRVGYPTLARLGLIPYHAFRAELAALAATGSIESDTAPDGSTTWRRPGELDPAADESAAAEDESGPAGDEIGPAEGEIGPAKDQIGPAHGPILG